MPISRSPPCIRLSPSLRRRGPDWVTELAIALPFYRQHVSQLAPGWLDTVKTPPPPIPGLATLQTWSVAMVFDIVANYEGAAELMAVSDQAGGEFLIYLDELIATVRTTLFSQPVRLPPPRRHSSRPSSAMRPGSSGRPVPIQPPKPIT